MPAPRLSVVLLTLSALLVLAPAGARAEDEADEDGPRVVGSGQDASGEHVVLAYTAEGPEVFAGKPGNLKRLHVKFINSDDDTYSVGTEEKGRIIFNTVEGRVIMPSVGFARPGSRTFSHKASRAVHDEVLARLRPAKTDPHATPFTHPGEAPHTKAVATERPSNSRVGGPTARARFREHDLRGYGSRGHRLRTHQPSRIRGRAPIKVRGH